ncbi:MAG: 50S ribosomal protein L6 [Dehalococcoidia bacterium]|nr:50S ribosomal protein L6 [Dehalococcoidia bacterium]
MSRVGKLPIALAEGVKVDIDGDMVVVKGPKGELSRMLPESMVVELEEKSITVSRPDDSRTSRSLHGLTRALLYNMVKGVSEGFEKELEIRGVGYRAQKEGDTLVLQMGYSHPVEFAPIPCISWELEGNTRIKVLGVDKELVGEVAAKIRAVRPPEPYKGKGIRYVGEVVRRKAGKAGRTAQ